MRLYRPYIPIETRCRVVLRQLGELWVDEYIARWRANASGLSSCLEIKLRELADLLGCEVNALQLDHDPALENRARKGEGKETVYTPSANSPEFLIYREKHAHHIKTNVRGDGAQYPDRVLAKRERRRRQKAAAKRKKKWPNRLRRSKTYKWPKRKLRKAINPRWRRATTRAGRSRT